MKRLPIRLDGPFNTTTMPLALWLAALETGFFVAAFAAFSLLVTMWFVLGSWDFRNDGSFWECIRPQRINRR